MRFVIVLTRLSGIMLIAPFFTGGYMPLQIRAVFTLFATLALTQALPLGDIPLELDLSTITTILLFEVLFGLVVGFSALCVFAGIQLAGQTIAFKMGFMMVNMIDPQSQVNMPMISFLLNFIGLLLFLMINGHHWFLLAVQESFATLPVGGFVLSGPLLNQIVGFSSSIFLIGVKIAAPVIVIIFVIDVVIGIVGRTAPQIHVIVVGMPLKILAGFATMSVSFYFLPRYLESLFLSLSRTIRALTMVGG